MYQNEQQYDDEVRQAQIEGLKKLQCEVKTIEQLIERLLTQLLECTSSLSERDFNVCSL